MKSPVIKVGVMTAPEIRLRRVAGMTEIENVAIGEGFHFGHRETLRYIGRVEVVDDGYGNKVAINEIPMEDYLRSVVSSEMNPDAPIEFVKAHAIISRSWLLSQLFPGAHVDKRYRCSETPEETVRWYDRDAHDLFDVCSTDHCQRYHGHTYPIKPRVEEAWRDTEGLVMTYDGEIVDARFSKCCGGAMERFSTCWQPVDLPYLQGLTDTEPQSPVDLSDETSATEWITTEPESFCSHPSERLLKIILNDFDRRTPHLYRWRQEYSGEELADIIRNRSGLDYGRIISLKPLHRGTSGRIDRLEIRGTKLTRIIGKELEIRRTLSLTHLYSSAFVAEPSDVDEADIPRRWTLRGAGWGHGVGLCQIGAAVMAEKGYDFRQILQHYFPGTSLTPIQEI